MTYLGSWACWNACFSFANISSVINFLAKFHHFSFFFPPPPFIMKPQLMILNFSWSSPRSFIQTPYNYGSESSYIVIIILSIVLNNSSIVLQLRSEAGDAYKNNLYKKQQCSYIAFYCLHIDRNPKDSGNVGDLRALSYW